MADDVRKFKFISPGVFVNEIDQSELPATPGAIGPLLIGSAQSGPLMRPITVNSFNDFVTIFGSPLPGGVGGDVWRNGNKTAPTYAPYAAQAYLDTLGVPAPPPPATPAGKEALLVLPIRKVVPGDWLCSHLARWMKLLALMRLASLLQMAPQ